jgi:cell division septal protein FtsQ
VQVTKISVEGAKTINAEEISSLIDTHINQKYSLLQIKLRKNILFFNETYVGDAILAKFSVIKKIQIKKNLPNDILVVITERTPIGTWCLIDQCSYFDEDGVMWGVALKSSGSLLLTVDDMRLPNQDLDKSEMSFMEATQRLTAGFKELDIKIQRIEIPADSIGDIRVYTGKGYYAVFNIDSYINKQLETLRIFLSNQSEDITMEYIDVSIEGRAYYK